MNQKVNMMSLSSLIRQRIYLNLNKAISNCEPLSAPSRFLHTRSRKRFYKNVSVVQNNGQFEINLDHRKLKTPSGTTFQVESEPLALAVANEWMGQKDNVMLSQMHMNGLCNTCIDDPGRASKDKLVEHILSFLETDTILFYAEEPPKLVELQKDKWSPVILWFRERYGVDIHPRQDILTVQISEGDRAVLKRHLESYSWTALQGFSFGVDAIKSLILSLAVLERHLTVEEAVSLTRLELEFQTDHWGNVEWAHDLELHDTTSRLSAAVLFFQFNNSVYKTKMKNIQS